MRSGFVVGERCHFLLKVINEREIQEEMGYNFDATVGLEINGRNVFQDLGTDGAEPVVVMHFLEEALQETRHLVNVFHLLESGEESEFWLLGTGFGILLRRHNGMLQVAIEVDGSFGPVGANVKDPGTVIVGSIELSDWVEAVINLANDLFGKFRHLSPKIFRELVTEKLAVQELESWLLVFNQSKVMNHHC